jgi:hypothetical protein
MTKHYVYDEGRVSYLRLPYPINFDPFNDPYWDGRLPSHITNRTQKGRAWKDGYITVPDLIFLGWTELTIRQHLGEPDVVRRLQGDGYSSAMRLYDRARVRGVLSSAPVRLMLRDRVVRRSRAA